MWRSDRRHHHIDVSGSRERSIDCCRSTALVNITKIYSPRNSRQPRKEHWVLSVTYYLNPAQVSVAAQTFPQFETINPLGLTITEFHENRLSVEPIDPSALQQTITTPITPRILPNSSAAETIR